MTDPTPDKPEEPQPPTPYSMKEAAVGLNEMVISLVAAGFSREEAIRFTAIWLAETNRVTPPGKDDDQ